ncbi:hypothetical protein KZ813_06455 [Sphingomonas sp. RHCKR7]|uniref:hypothetical protein n=1 Tax=Sphingomonas folli TaxID=2862497 RepID=UPI001CA57742|nr:hypothetical protein [Sphingomonas folli]MBW6526478.1 hypothetical protein [Sphingomonas folli]
MPERGDESDVALLRRMALRCRDIARAIDDGSAQMALLIMDREMSERADILEQRLQSLGLH